MNEENENKQVQIGGSTTSTAISTGISLEDFKSFFYLINAKPDRETKFYKDSKIVSPDNIIELNNLINEKLKLHNIVTSQVNLMVSFANNRNLDFGTWQQFLNEKWNSSTITKSVVITWDFNISLPGYKFPQRHTVKLRIGSGMKPKDVFELVFNHEDEEQIHEAFSHSICSIDFINPIISSEIFLIIENWHKALPKNFFKSKSHELLRKYSNIIGQFIIFSVLTAGSLILFWLSKAYLKLVWADSNNQLFYSRLYGGLLISYLLIFIFNKIGKYWSNLTISHIGRLKPTNIFKFTKGDVNANEENVKKNNKILSMIGIKIIISVVINIIAYLSSNFWEFLVNLIVK